MMTVHVRRLINNSTYMEREKEVLISHRLRSLNLMNSGAASKRMSGIGGG